MNTRDWARKMANDGHGEFEGYLRGTSTFAECATEWIDDCLATINRPSDAIVAAKKKYEAGEDPEAVLKELLGV